MKKKWAVIFIAVGLVMGIATGRLLFAEEQDSQSGDMQDSGMMNQQQGGPGMMGQGRGMNGPMQGMQGKGMMMEHMMMGGKSSMIATPDGGVIILEGHRLMKYDSQLTLVKEVELPKPGPKGKMDRRGSPDNANDEGAAPQSSPAAAAGDSAQQ